MYKRNYITILLCICITSYLTMFTMKAEAIDIDEIYDKKEKKEMFRMYNHPALESMRYNISEKENLAMFIQSISGLTNYNSIFIIEECKKENVDIFILLGLIRRESNFNTYAVGTSGERGLGQIMEDTGKELSKKLGYTFHPNRLFEPRYNLELAIAHLSDLYKLYNRDIHKTLTAYNRGKQGLINYMQQNNSKYEKPQISDYSAQIILYAQEFREGFKNYKN